MDKISINDLSPYYQRLEIIEATARQIIKDFEIFGAEITFSGDPGSAYAELKSKITEIVSKMMNENFEKFLSLLYRIDVSEEKAKEISLNSPLKFEELISELIIEREFKKVLTRIYYKQ